MDQNLIPRKAQGGNGNGHRKRGRPKGMTKDKCNVNGTLGRPRGSSTMNKNGTPEPILIARRANGRAADMITNAISGVIASKAVQLEELVLRQLEAVASSDIRRLPGVPDDLDESVALALSSISCRPLTYMGQAVLHPKTGEPLMSYSYSFWPKLQATDQINRHIGWYKADNDQSKPQNNIQINYQRVDLSGLTEEQLARKFQLELELAKVIGDPIVELLPGP